MIKLFLIRVAISLLFLLALVKLSRAESSNWPAQVVIGYGVTVTTTQIAKKLDMDYPVLTGALAGLSISAFNAIYSDKISDQTIKGNMMGVLLGSMFNMALEF